jgi:hypothetical protein
MKALLVKPPEKSLHLQVTSHTVYILDLRERRLNIGVEELPTHCKLVKDRTAYIGEIM